MAEPKCKRKARIRIKYTHQYSECCTPRQGQAHSYQRRTVGFILLGRRRRVAMVVIFCGAGSGIDFAREYSRITT